jgi:hypothetical protein
VGIDAGGGEVKTRFRKVRVSEGLFEALADRVEWGEPDKQGFYTPSIFREAAALTPAVLRVVLPRAIEKARQRFATEIVDNVPADEGDEVMAMLVSDGEFAGRILAALDTEGSDR